MAPVYPRWRGEHALRSRPAVTDCGLSPLARGTPCSLHPYKPSLRFIPAGAGNTSATTSNQLGFTVYPRWRGEHWLYPLLFAIKHGLSPLARGTHRIRSGGAGRDRFIPAGAGNTGRINSEKPRSAVYPRWRGEHLVCNNPSSQKYGLSPLARGTHAITEDAQMLTRFIPAGAGNTR